MPVLCHSFSRLNNLNENQVQTLFEKQARSLTHQKRLTACASGDKFLVATSGCRWEWTLWKLAQVRG